MKTCLVVFYSQTGVTRKVADAIRGNYSCDIEQIVDAAPRQGWLGYTRAIYEVLRGKTAAIKPMSKNPADYAVTILGAPVWAGNVAAPMRSYIAQNKHNFNQIAAFCTMGGTGGTNVLEQIGKLSGKQPISKMALTEKQVNADQYLDDIKDFKKSLVSMAA
jgi:flavodoxin